MTVSTVESWSYNHTDEQRNNISIKLVEMFKDGKLIVNTIRANGATIPVTPISTLSNVEVNGNIVTTGVTYTWSNTDAANEYLTFISNLSPTTANIVS